MDKVTVKDGLNSELDELRQGSALEVEPNAVSSAKEGARLLSFGKLELCRGDILLIDNLIRLYPTVTFAGGWELEFVDVSCARPCGLRYVLNEGGIVCKADSCCRASHLQIERTVESAASSCGGDSDVKGVRLVVSWHCGVDKSV